MSTSSPSTNPTLSSKCSICFTSPPKYRCPRCAARTCSLKCVQTHKSRSICSGIRDATGYLPRRQLATDKAFDSDFNLLSGIERGVEKAERILAVHAGNPGSPGADRRVRKAVLQAGVTVWRAPGSVKRARENRTVVDRRLVIRWTVEWRFLGLGVVSLASEAVSLSEAHDVAVLDAYMSSLERVAKRRIGEYARSAGVVMPSGYKGQKDLVDHLESKDAHVAVEESTQIRDGETASTNSDEAVVVLDSDIAAQSDEDANTQHVNTNKRKFFIHRPELSSAKRQIVSPVDGMRSLRDILNGKTVREFPTFLVEIPDSDLIDWTSWHVEGEIDDLETAQTQESYACKPV